MSGRVYTTRDWSTPRFIQTKGSRAAPGRVYTTGGLCCIKMGLHHQGLSCTWTCLDNKSMQLDMPGQQRPVLHLDVSAPQEPEQHRHLSTVHYRGLYCTWTCLHHRSLSSTCICLQYTTETSTAPGRVYTTESFAAPGRVSKTGA